MISCPACLLPPALPRGALLRCPCGRLGVGEASGSLASGPSRSLDFGSPGLSLEDGLLMAWDGAGWSPVEEGLGS